MLLILATIYNFTLSIVTLSEVEGTTNEAHRTFIIEASTSLSLTFQVSVKRYIITLIFNYSIFITHCSLF